MPEFLSRVPLPSPTTTPSIHAESVYVPASQSSQSQPASPQPPQAQPPDCQTQFSIAADSQQTDCRILLHDSECSSDEIEDCAKLPLWRTKRALGGPVFHPPSPGLAPQRHKSAARSPQPRCHLPHPRCHTPDEPGWRRAPPKAAPTPKRILLAQSLPAAKYGSPNNSIRQYFPLATVVVDVESQACQSSLAAADSLSHSEPACQQECPSPTESICLDYPDGPCFPDIPPPMCFLKPEK